MLNKNGFLVISMVILVNISGNANAVPIITINSPPNANISDNTPEYNFTTKELADLWYSLDGGTNRTVENDQVEWNGTIYKDMTPADGDEETEVNNEWRGHGGFENNAIANNTFSKIGDVSIEFTRNVTGLARAELRTGWDQYDLDWNLSGFSEMEFWVYTNGSENITRILIQTVDCCYFYYDTNIVLPTNSWYRVIVPLSVFEIYGSPDWVYVNMLNISFEGNSIGSHVFIDGVRFNGHGLLEGSHYIMVHANDTGGNLNSSTRYFNLTSDIFPPEITIHSPPNATISDNTPLLKVTLNELGDIWYSLDGGPNKTGCSSCDIFETEFLGPQIAYPVNYTDGQLGRGNTLSEVTADDGIYADLLENDDTGWMVVNFSDDLFEVGDVIAKFILTIQHYESSTDLADDLEAYYMAGNNDTWISMGTPTKSTAEISFSYDLMAAGIDTPAEANGVKIRWEMGHFTLETVITFVDFFKIDYMAELYDGPHNITVYAKDTEGNLNSSTVWFNIGPTNLEAAYNPNGTIMITWNGTTTSSSYDIYITNNYSAGFNLSNPNVTNVTETSWTDPDAINYSQRYYKVGVTDATGSVSSETVGKFDIELHSGLNLVSLPLIPANNSIKEVLHQNASNYDISEIYYPKPSGEYMISTLYPSNSPGYWWSPENFTTLDNDKGYWFKLSQDYNFTLVGEVPISNRSVNLSAGMNLVGWTSLEERKLWNAINQSDSDYNITQSHSLTPSGDYMVSTFYPENSPDYWWSPGEFYSLSPARGYWFNSNQSFAWNYAP